MKKLILLSVLATLCLFCPAWAQNTSTPGALIRGVVTDENGKPLAGAGARILNHSSNTTADSSGRFSLFATVRKGALITSYAGFKNDTIEFDLSQRSEYRITLQPLNLSLQEVVVSTGYQTLNKERATGAFVQVDNQLLNRRPGTDVLSRLEGIVPGLLFNRNTSNASRGIADISIRGHSTLMSNDQPLVVIDGFPYEGDINNLNPNDIESITVLKDAAAASIWGVRSGNGVIVLTTKRGRLNQKLKVQFNANVTVGEKPDLYYSPAFLSSGDYIDIEKLLFERGAFNSQITSPTQVISPVIMLLTDQRSGLITAAAANAGIDALRSVDTRDGLTQYFYQRSLLQQYNLNFQGGGEKSSFYFSLGEDRNRTVATGNTGNRITLNGNYTLSPIRHLKLIIGTNFIRSDQRDNSVVDNLNAGGLYVTGNLPYLQFAGNHGEPLAISKSLNPNFINTAEQQGFLNWQFRPLDELRNSDNNTVSIDNRYNANLIYQPFKGLSADVKYQYQHSSAIRNDYYNTATFFTRNLINQYAQKNTSGTFQYPIPVGGILQNSNAYLKAEQVRAQLNYDASIGIKHEINAIGGAEINSRINCSNGGTAYGYNKDTEASVAQVDYLTLFNRNPGVGSAQVPNNQSFSKTTDHFLSYFANAAYTYDRRYTVSVSGRIDKSNLFGVSTNQKAVPLFSTGGAWDLGKEKFYNFNFLPRLRLRATYGYNANINKAATAVTTLRQQSNSFFNGLPYNTIANPGNDELRWEKARMINLAVDFGLQNNILTGTFDYYLKKSTDLFGLSSLPPSTGIPTFFGNTASTEGHGLDLVLNSRNVTGKHLIWTTDLQLSYVMDKVISYDVPSTVTAYLSSGIGGSITPIAGQPMFGLYTIRSGPLTPDKGDPQGYLNGQLSTDYAKIISNTGVSDLQLSGNSRPATFGSLRNTVSYNQWSLSLNVIFKLNYSFRRSSTPLSYQNIAYNGGHQDYYQRWQKPGDEEFTTVPSIQLPPGDNNRSYFYQYSQALVEKGDHVRLQDIRISYLLKRATNKKLVFEQVQFFGYLNNVGILWRANSRGLDPDLYSGVFPLPTTLSFGINANF